MRRLDLSPEKKLRGAARHQRSFFAAMDRLSGWFPRADALDGGFAAVKLPAYDKAVSERHGSMGFRHAVVARLVQAAAEVSALKPAGSAARVAAIVEWPDLWGSELCVFADSAAAHGHSPEFRAQSPLPARTDWEGGWVEATLPDEDLLAEAGVALPPGFTAHGTKLRSYDRDSDLLRVSEEWVVMDKAA